MFIDDVKIERGDIANLGNYIPCGEYNPYKIRPWAIYNEYGLLTVVFSEEHEALDIAVDEDRLDSCLISQEDYDAMSGDEKEDVTYLGNASEPFNLDYISMRALPNLPFLEMYRAEYPQED